MSHLKETNWFSFFIIFRFIEILISISKFYKTQSAQPMWFTKLCLNSLSRLKNLAQQNWIFFFHIILINFIIYWREFWLFGAIMRPMTTVQVLILHMQSIVWFVRARMKLIKKEALIITCKARTIYILIWHLLSFSLINLLTKRTKHPSDSCLTNWSTEMQVSVLFKLAAPIPDYDQIYQFHILIFSNIIITTNDSYDYCLILK